MTINELKDKVFGMGYDHANAGNDRTPSNDNDFNELITGIDKQTRRQLTISWVGGWNQYHDSAFEMEGRL